MPFISSPIAYPATSSPRQDSPKKRKRSDAEREPLKDIPANSEPRLLGGFVLDDSDNEDGGLHAAALDGESLLEERDLQERSHRSNGNAKNETLFNEHAEDLTDEPAEQEQLDLTEKHADVGLGAEYKLRREYISTRTCSGRFLNISTRIARDRVSYEQLIASRSTTLPGHAQRSYYGIDIHRLIDEANAQTAIKRETSSTSAPTELQPTQSEPARSKTLLWTEKYRAKKFTDLVGDERTHRAVLRWLKGWDPIVFPNAQRPKAKIRRESEDTENTREHRKVLLLSGPPGLGKTTLAHVCAKQAGYEVQEINASDERSRDVVKGRIRDMVGTENVRSIDSNVNANGKPSKVARPVCVVVDEVDGVVGGAGGAGEGGFMRALVDLLVLDQKNSNAVGVRTAVGTTRRKKNGDNFRLMRPLILICNDAYHPSLRPLRQGAMSEFIHIRKPPLNMIAPRLKMIFEKEGIECDGDGVRRLCEAAWGVSTRKGERSMGNGTGEGDIRGILVVGEWVAGKLQAESSLEKTKTRLTKRWIEEKVVGDLTHGSGAGAAARGLGRGSTKEVVERIFLHNGGFPAASSHSGQNQGGLDLQERSVASESNKKRTLDRLKEMIESSGEDDRIMTDCFASYPSHPFQDDTMLTKPCHAYDWLHFHDTISHLVHTSHEWELAPYLSQGSLAFHHLFASTSRHSMQAATHETAQRDDDQAQDGERVHPLSGPRADYTAHETQRANRETLQHLQTKLSIPLHRAFRSLESLSADLLPYVCRILNPDVKPVVVGGSEKGVASVRRAAEKELVARGVQAMIACGVKFEKGRLDGGETAPTLGLVFRMEPPLDSLSMFETADKGVDGAGKVRYAVRQVLEQEWRKEVAKREQEARVRRAKGLKEVEDEDDKVTADRKREEGRDKASDNSTKSSKVGIKRDFFGRPVLEEPSSLLLEGSDEQGRPANKKSKVSGAKDAAADEQRVWVTYHEGFSNAVRKPITLKELLEGL